MPLFHENPGGWNIVRCVRVLKKKDDPPWRRKQWWNPFPQNQDGCIFLSSSFCLSIFPYQLPSWFCIPGWGIFVCVFFFALESRVNSEREFAQIPWAGKLTWNIMAAFGGLQGYSYMKETCRFVYPPQTGVYLSGSKCWFFNYFFPLVSF